MAIRSYVFTLFTVIQGHRFWYQSKERTRRPISKLLRIIANLLVEFAHSAGSTSL